jgi:hypothetical protein
VQQAHLTVDGIMDFVEFLACETEASGIADVEVGEDLEVDFSGEGVEGCGCAGVRWRRAWIMPLALRG